MKATRTLILYNHYLADLIIPILKKEEIKFISVERDKTSQMEEMLAKHYPTQIVIESNIDNHKNLEILKKCIAICENSNIVFVTESSVLDSCVRLVKAGADEVILSSELPLKSNLFKDLDRTLNYRKRLVRKSDVENISQAVAKIGSWEYNTVQNVLFWSGITKALHEVPNDYVPNVADAINFYNEGWSRDTLSEAFANLLRTGEQVNLELPITTAKNNEVWVCARGEAQFIGNKCVRVFGTFQDITHHKILENKLRNSELKYQKVVEATNDIIWEVEIGTDRIRYARIGNEKTSLFKEISVMGILRKIHPDDRTLFNESMKGAVSNANTNYWYCQYRIKNEKGKYVWIEDNASIIRDEAKNALKIIGAAKNVSEKKNHLKKIESQNAIFRKIAWTQSHVLRAPVVNILGLLSLLKLEMNSTKETDEIIFFLENAAKELDETIIETVRQSTRALEAAKKKDDSEKNMANYIIKDWY